MHVEEGRLVKTGVDEWGVQCHCLCGGGVTGWCHHVEWGCRSPCQLAGVVAA